jgi:diphthine synthase
MEEYEKAIKKKLTPIYRKSLENDSKEFLTSLKGINSAILISGDPFIATTHYMLLLEAVQLGLHVEIYNNVSIYSVAPSFTGLSAYKFGKTVTISFPDRISSEASYDLIRANLSINAHTLVLLDVDLEKKTFLSIDEALQILLGLESIKKDQLFFPETFLIALSKLGSSEAKISYKSIKNLQLDSWSKFGPPQALVVPAKLSVPEKEIVETMWQKPIPNFHFRTRKTKIVVTGTFDIIHPGHLMFFENAKKLSVPSELWIVVARNSSIKDFKKRNPILDENVRVTMLKALKIVDHVLLGNEGPDKIKIMEEIQPDIIVLGYDQWIDPEKLKKELDNRGLSKTQVIKLDKYGSNGYSSSTDIRNKIISSQEK